MKRLTPLLVLVAGLLLVACGGKTLDTKNVETDIQKIASASGVETEAKCPDEVSDAEKGKTYECTVTYAGNENNQQTVEMKIADDEARSDFADQEAVSDEVAIRAIVAQTDADPATLCQHVSEEALEQLETTEEDCPTDAAENADEEPANVQSLEIEGDAATMVTNDADGSETTTTFERGEDGAWVVASFEAAE